MTSPTFQKVAIVGVGAIGGLFAGWLGSRLPAGQIQLSAVARGATLRALRERGLVWVDAEGAEHSVPVNASDDPASLGVQDLVIVSVKGPAMPTIAPAVRALMGPHTVVLVAMNGVPWWFFDGLPGEAAGLQLKAVDPLGLTAQNIPTAQVIGCVVHASAAAPLPARIGRVKNTCRW
jgi:2-dehydropantoate 2-reductase